MNLFKKSTEKNHTGNLPCMKSDLKSKTELFNEVVEMFIIERKRIMAREQLKKMNREELEKHKNKLFEELMDENKPVSLRNELFDVLDLLHARRNQENQEGPPFEPLQELAFV